jgi:hypothetical protein
MEARAEAAARGLRRTTIGVYNDVITAIERKLEQPVRGQRGATR